MEIRNCPVNLAVDATLSSQHSSKLPEMTPAFASLPHSTCSIAQIEKVQLLETTTFLEGAPSNTLSALEDCLW